jgi:threonine dehydrogenase-like Zn-dependent dehydrogenase
MAEMVLAAVKVGPRAAEVRELPMPEIPADAALLKVTAAGVCGHDIATFDEPLKDGPFILGHENVGVIAKIGPVAAKRWRLREGDRIALEGYRGCGQCEFCRTGYVGFCPEEGDPDADAIEPGSLPSLQPSRNGGFSQYMYLPPTTRFHRVPENLSDQEAALAIPFGNGWEWAYEVGQVRPGMTVLIQGPGQQGLGCLMAAKEAGADCIIMSGLSRDTRRLEVARLMGADYTIDVENEDLRERVHEITGGRGIDVALDMAVAGAPTILPAIDLLRPRGALVLVGGEQPALANFPIGQLPRKGLSLRGANGHKLLSVDMALHVMASGRYPIHEVTSHRFTLSQVGWAIRSTAGEGEPGAVHVSVDPWAPL